MLAIPLAAAAVLGLTSSAHCAAMCGPLVAATCGTKKSGASAMGYFVGRTFGYSLVGAVAAAVGGPFVGPTASRTVQIAAAIAVGAVLAWNGIRLLRRRASGDLVELRRPPSSVARAWARFIRLLPRGGLPLGLATSVFPCGALVGAVLTAAASGAWWIGAAMMAAFALASAPALGLAALVGTRVRALVATARRAQIAAGVALIAVAAWIVVTPVSAAVRAGRGGPACPHCHPHPR
jgi:sulfite exporter TauE/SafE